MDDEEEWILQQAIQREETFAQAYVAFSTGWPSADKADCFLNRGLLLIACKAFFSDIVRLKSFHKIAILDSHKRAGYLVKWLMRFRPIQYHSNYICVRLTVVNELFSLWLACEHLSLDIKEIPENLRDNFLYHFRYRTVDPDALAFSFYILQQSASLGFLGSMGKSSDSH